MAKAPLKYQLINPLKIKTEPGSIDFPQARAMADEKVKSLCSDPTLVSWYDASTGESFPKTECQNPGKPGWLRYAEAQKCDTTVDINDEQYVFVYLTQP